MKDPEDTLTVRVRRIDIALALAAPADANRERTCPIAQALKRIGFPGVEVHSEDLKLEPFGRYIGLPERAINFIESFDNGIPVRGFTFEIDKS